MAKYTIGLDYGTLSGRALLVDVKTGAELAAAVYDYPHAVMDAALPDGTPLPPDWALQHPQDYLDVLRHTIPAVLKESGIDPADVVGIGSDFTASTLLPVTDDGTPLCFLPAYEHRPHAWVKLWKHHAAQKQANRVNALAAERGESWLRRYGGKVSSEWQLPKILQMLDEDPDLYAAAAHFTEAGDWLAWQLTGVPSKNACGAGYKGLWSKTDGYPSHDFLRALDPRLETYIEDKMNFPVLAAGSRAGYLTPAMAAELGLPAGIPVSAGGIDAHVCMPAVKIAEPGQMLAIMGTSTCHMLLGRQNIPVDGICGIVEDGILPGFFGYEAGQGCVGDHFAWFVDNCVPESYRAEAEKRGLNIHKLLREKAQRLAPGESGLVALDWWNGNRSVLVDADLTGLLLGMTLQTKPEEIYRALIEATAYGTRMIIETLAAAGVPTRGLCASGGIAKKDPMMMQIYSDVLNLPIRIAGSEHGPALGSAIFGAVAAGCAAGGWDTVAEAAEAMGKLDDTVYHPQPSAVAIYDRLYAEYEKLHDCFGRGENDVMKRLKALRAEVRRG